MIIIDKFFEKIVKFFNSLISQNFKLRHKYQNKNQITNSDFIICLLKKKNFLPTYIIDVGCGYGQWTKKLIKHYPDSKYILFDADKSNFDKLNNLKNNIHNLNFKICLLSDDKKSYKFFNMGYGSSIFEEQTTFKRKTEELISTTLYDELPKNITNQSDNLIKLDVQGSELKILKGLNDLINYFEVIILEVSLHNYNRSSPLFSEVMDYMNSKNYRLLEIFDLKRLGDKNSYLLQFDCLFVKNNSNLLNVKF